MIRDQAKAVVAAAAILKRKYIQIEASHLVADAERAYHKANPPKQGSRTDVNNFSFTEGEVNPKLTTNIRNAHSKLDDEQYAKLKTESREAEEPLTRKAIERRGRAIQKEKQSEDHAALEPVRTYFWLSKALRIFVSPLMLSFISINESLGLLTSFSYAGTPRFLILSS